MDYILATITVIAVLGIYWLIHDLAVKINDIQHTYTTDTFNKAILYGKMKFGHFRRAVSNDDCEHYARWQLNHARCEAENLATKTMFEHRLHHIPVGIKQPTDIDLPLISLARDYGLVIRMIVDERVCFEKVAST